MVGFRAAGIEIDGWFVGREVVRSRVLIYVNLNLDENGYLLEVSNFKCFFSEIKALQVYKFHDVSFVIFV